MIFRGCYPYLQNDECIGPSQPPPSGRWRWLRSIDRHLERNRSLYYAALRNVSGGRYRADPKSYGFEPITWFFLKMIRNALNDVVLLRQRYAALRVH